MLGLRLLAPQLGYHLRRHDRGLGLDRHVCSFFVATGFNFVLTFFVVSAYLDRLCEHLFRTRGVNLGIFRGRFRRKVGLCPAVRVLRRHDPAGRRHRELRAAPG